MATRVPEKDSLLDIYIRDTTARLEAGTPTGAVRLGLTTAQAAQWIAYRDAWVILYPKFTAKASRTTDITKDKNQLKKDFRTFAKLPLKRIEISENLTNADRVTFNIPVPDTTNTERGPIIDIPFAQLKGVGGGILEVHARREHDASRSSMHLLADAIEFKYSIIDKGFKPSGSGDSDTGGEPPKPKDMTTSVISTSAFWRINLGEDAQGKRIIGFLRWLNLTNPAHNGGWSEMLMGLIS